jgi:hypothetical protein
MGTGTQRAAGLSAGRLHAGPSQLGLRQCRTPRWVIGTPATGMPKSHGIMLAHDAALGHLHTRRTYASATQAALVQDVALRYG